MNFKHKTPFVVAAVAVLSSVASAQIGQAFRSYSERTAGPEVFKTGALTWTGTYFPLTNFSVSGAIGNGGGTHAAWGQTIALSATRPLRNGRDLSFGGWYFHSNDSKDLYQVQLGLFEKPHTIMGKDSKEGDEAVLATSLGFQAAYLNSNKGNASSTTALAIYDVDLPKNRFRLQFGGGLYFDLADQIEPTQNGTNTEFPLVPRHTVSLTYFANASLKLKSRKPSSGAWSINGGVWYVHDRNVDFNRFTLGIGYSF